MEYLDKTGLAHLITKIKENTNGGGTGNVSSDIIHSIMVVDELPETEVEGVLYLVKESENESVELINLMPNLVSYNVTSNGVSFVCCCG